MERPNYQLALLHIATPGPGRVRRSISDRGTSPRKRTVGLDLPVFFRGDYSSPDRLGNRGPEPNERPVGLRVPDVPRRRPAWRIRSRGPGRRTERDVSDPTFQEETRHLRRTQLNKNLPITNVKKICSGSVDRKFLLLVRSDSLGYRRTYFKPGLKRHFHGGTRCGREGGRGRKRRTLENRVALGTDLSPKTFTPHKE